MNTTLKTASLALAGILFAGATSATTVTANFEGSNIEGTAIGQGGFPASVLGTGLTATIIGESDAMGVEGVELPPPFGSFTAASSEAISYALTSFSVDIPSIGFSETATDARIFIFDNTRTVQGNPDLIIASGLVNGFDLIYRASFPTDTYSGRDLSVAIEQGLSQTTPNSQSIRLVNRNLGLIRAGIRADVALTDIMLVDPTAPPANPGNGGSTPPTTGGGGSGGGTPTIAPVPLPASLPLILVGLGALGIMRRRQA